MTLRNRWLLLFAFGLLPLALSGFSHAWITVALGWYGLLLLFALTDWLLLPRPEQIGVEREVEERLAPGVANTVRIRVRNTSDQPQRVEVRDSPPTAFHTDLDEACLPFSLPPHARHAIEYQVTPRERGDYLFGELSVRVAGRLGMVSRQWRVARPAAVRVYPRFAPTTQFQLTARRDRLQQSGIRTARLQGAGSEFESLRDYQPDDEMRRIDWKATARSGKLVARQYEVERSQNVLLILDVGRTMRAEINGVAKLDYAINAALLLAQVAGEGEDKVGLLVFDSTIRTYLPPKKGRAQLYAILDALYNVRASLEESDYRTALAYLQTRYRRRSLMVCFTDFWDPDSSRQTLSEIVALQPRHLVAAVTLLDSKIQDAAHQEAESVKAVYEKAVATQVLEDRQRALNILTQRGVLVVDSPADRLSAELVSRYLDVKQRMML